MATVVKTWTFVSGPEGLADAGNHATIGFAAVASDGNPADSIGFTTATKNLSSATEYARNASTGETWETWGVPQGSTVTQVQITAWDYRLVANTKLTGHTIQARIIGSGGASVHSVGDALDASLPTTTGAWTAGSAGTARAVDAGSQASTTDVRLELQYIVSTSAGSGSADVDQRFDQIALTITYSSGPISSGPHVATAVGTGSRTIVTFLVRGGTAAGLGNGTRSVLPGPLAAVASAVGAGTRSVLLGAYNAVGTGIGALATSKVFLVTAEAISTGIGTVATTVTYVVSAAATSLGIGTVATAVIFLELLEAVGSGIGNISTQFIPGGVVTFIRRIRARISNLHG